jgi:protein SCO1/2
VAVPGRKLLVGLLAIVVVAVSVVGVTLATRPADPKLDNLGEVPAFSLVDERGQPFTEAALRGHVTIVSFIFTRCPDICPVTSLKMQHLQEQTFDVGDKVKLLSISIDPAYDTPERLAAYAPRYQADTTRWRFITGPVDRVNALVEKGLMTSMIAEGERNGIPKITHRGYLALIDPQLHIRGFFEQDDPGLQMLVKAARFLARTMM